MKTKHVWSRLEAMTAAHRHAAALADPDVQPLTDEAMDRMNRALAEYMITGIKTTVSFQQAIMQDPNFRRGVYSTGFVEQLLGGARRELIEEKT